MIKPKRNPPQAPAKATASPKTEIASLAAELARLKTETDTAYKAYLSRKLDPVIAAPFLRQWLRMCVAMTALAKVQPRADQEARNVLKVSDVEAVWSRTISELRSSVEAIPRRIATAPLFAKLDAVDVEQLIGREISSVFTHLSAGAFLNKDK